MASRNDCLQNLVSSLNGIIGLLADLRWAKNVCYVKHPCLTKCSPESVVQVYGEWMIIRVCSLCRNSDNDWEIDCSQSPTFPWDHIVGVDHSVRLGRHFSLLTREKLGEKKMLLGTVTASLRLAFTELDAPATATPDWSRDNRVYQSAAERWQIEWQKVAFITSRLRPKNGIDFGIIFCTGGPDVEYD